MTLVEFLLARIAKDEAMWALAKRAGLAWTAGREVTPAVPPTGFSSRMLADCEAKRRIVEEVHFDGRDGDYTESWCSTCSDDECLVRLPCPTLRQPPGLPRGVAPLGALPLPDRQSGRGCGLCE